MEDTSREDGAYKVFSDLVRCETRLYNAVGDLLREGHDISAAQFEYLRYVGAHPDSRVAEIASNFAAGIGAISKLTDRLEDRGWVVRRPNPDDRRSSLINLTQAGSVLVEQAAEAVDARLRDLLGATVDPDHANPVAAALADLRQRLEAARVGIPAG